MKQPNHSSGSSDVVDNVAIGQLFEIVKSLAVNIAELTSKVAFLVSQPSEIQSHTNNETQANRGSEYIRRDELFLELKEFEERKKRTKSIIIKGTKARNIQQFRPIFDDICQYLIGSPPVFDDIVCVSETNSIFRVKLQDMDSKYAIISNAKNLNRNDNFKQVYISRDLTYIQRQELAVRRAALRAGSSGTPASGANSAPILRPTESISISQGESVNVTATANTGTGLALQLARDGLGTASSVPNDDIPVSNFAVPTGSGLNVSVPTAIIQVNHDSIEPTDTTGQVSTRMTRNSSTLGRQATQGSSGNFC